METIRLDSWQSPATQYPRTKFGNAKIGTHHWAKSHLYDGYGTTTPEGIVCWKIVAMRRLRMTHLSIDGKVWMVDDPPHWWAIQEYAKLYHGHVLVAGLGLGLVIHALKANDKVTKITVVEREPDVIAAIKPNVPKCNIVCADWYKYNKAKGVDGVFFDLFVGDAYKMIPMALHEMFHLRERFPGAIHRILGFNNDVMIQQCEFAENSTRCLREGMSKCQRS